MKEQLQSPQGIREKLVRVNQSLARVDRIYQAVGTTLANKRLSAGFSNEEFITQVAKLVDDAQKVRERLEKRAKPTLLSQKESLERQLAIIKNPSLLEEQLSQIDYFVQRGNLPGWVLEDGKKVLVSFKELSQEAKEIPEIKIDEQKREITIDQRTTEIPDDINWALFLHFSQNPEIDISGADLVKVAKEAGSDLTSAEILVTTLRRIIETDPQNTQLITRSGSIRNALYRLNAKVKFTKEQEELVLPDSQSGEGLYEVAARVGKVNRRRPRSPRFPQHGGSLRRTVLPVITKRSKEAEKS